MITQTNKPHIPQHLSWVQCTAGGRTPFWCETRRLLIDADEQDCQHIIQSLRAGKTVCFDQSDMSLRARPFAPQDHKRLRHLVTFEQKDFTLTGFRADLALYSNSQGEYYSMAEMAERGFLPNATVPLDPLNTSIYQGNTLLDVFIPVRRGPANFHFAKNVPL